MTVTAVNDRKTHTGDGATTTPFDFSFKVFDTTDIEVYVDGTLQTITTHYSVSLSDSGNSGGTVTFVTAPADGADILIRRKLTLTQGTVLPIEGPFPSKSVEKMVDRNTLLNQQINTELQRAIRLATTYTDTFDMALPTTLTARRAIMVNTDGDGFELSTYDPDEQVADAEVFATAAAASAAAAATAETNAETAQAAAEAAQAAAETAEANAETAQAAAEAAETNAETAQAAAEAAQAAAETAETNAETAQAAAEAAQAAAETAEANAATSETNAATSETNAATSATNAANSATAAQTAETNAETAQAAAEAAQAAAETAETNAEAAAASIDTTLYQGFRAGAAPTYIGNRTLTFPAFNHRDSTNAYNIKKSTATTVDLDTTGVGGLDTGSPANNTLYHCYVISKAGGVDAGVIFSTVNEAVSGSITMPTDYTLKRQVPFFLLTDGSANIRPFTVGAGWPYRPWVDFNVNFAFVTDGTVGPTNVVNGGSSTTFGTTSLAAYLPPTYTKKARLWMGVADANGNQFLYRTSASYNSKERLVNAAITYQEFFDEIEVTSTPSFQWAWNTNTGGQTFDCAVAGGLLEVA